jgi:hypothetical protein
MEATISSALTTASRPSVSVFSPAGAPWKASESPTTTPWTVRISGRPSGVVEARWTTGARSSRATALARSIRKISLRMPRR